MANHWTTASLRDPLTEKIIGAAIEVHRHLGPGLLESAYEQCLCWELSERGLRFRRQVPLPINYRGKAVDVGYRLDVIVLDLVLLELKAVEGIASIHVSQALTYLKLSGLHVALILNFNTPVLRDGVRRLVL
jgi:GxxExxY protein